MEPLQWVEETEKKFTFDAEDVEEILSTGEKDIVPHVALDEARS